MKPAIQSKTLWLNGVLLLAFALIELAAMTFEFFMPEWVYASMIFGSSAGNYILRYFTNEPIR